MKITRLYFRTFLNRGHYCNRAAAGGSSTPAGDQEITPNLNFYNWSYYIADQTIPEFQQEFDVRVRYDNYSSNNELLAKLQAGASGYDLIVSQ